MKFKINDIITITTSFETKFGDILTDVDGIIRSIDCDNNEYQVKVRVGEDDTQIFYFSEDEVQ
jgi:hypothetical protein